MSCIELHCPHRGLIAPYDRKPLGLAAEMFVNYESEGAEAMWPRALRNWTIVRREAEKTESQFLNRVSPFQKQLVLLLHEWWTNVTEDNQKIIEMLEEFMKTETQEPIPQSVQREMSNYCCQLCNLFVSEFVDLDTVTFQRRKAQDEAGWIAACRRAATETASNFCEIMKAKAEAESRLPAGASSSGRVRIALNPSDSSVSNGSPNAILESCPWLPDHNKHGLPYFLWDIEGKRTVRFEEHDERPGYAIVSHTWGRWRIRDQADIDLPGVPWRIPQNTRFDVTRLPEELLSSIHVFGGAKFVWLDLLCIPQDGSELAKIEIGRQAAIFGNATRAICWMSNIHDLAGLQWAVTWLAMGFARHEANLKDEQVDGAFMLVDSMARKSPGIGVREAILLTTKPDDGERQDMGETVSVKHIDKGWFSSLWTLQEATLRPDIVFCDHNWRPLTMATQSRPIPLDYILALVKWYRQTLISDRSLENHLSRHVAADPLPVIELCALLDQSGLTGLMFEPSVLAVLAAADRRQCESRRAEAIMSVVGSRIWYTRVHSDAEREANLIMGRYPVEFLRETRAREGASFFASQYGNFCCFWDPLIPLKYGDDDHECFPRWPGVCQTCQKSRPLRLGETSRVAGTILPFDPLRYNSKINYLVPRNVGHFTLDDWQIADDGRVVVPKALVVASTDPALHPEPAVAKPNTAVWYIWGPKSLDAQVMMSETDSNMRGFRTMNLHHYLCQLGEEHLMKHVILTLVGRTVIRGVILMQSKLPDDDGRTYSKLGDVKVINLHQTAGFRQSVQQVDWEII